MRDVLAKMRECGKDVKMRDFPHDCGMVDTYGEFTESTWLDDATAVVPNDHDVAR